MVEAGGHLDLTNSFAIAGEFDLTIGSSGLDVNANATIAAFGLNIAVSGSANIDAFPGGAGFVYYNQGSANFDYDNGLFQLDGSYIVDINSNFGLYEISIPNASASVLGLSVSGSATITDDAGDVDLNASLNLVIPDVTTFSFSVATSNSSGTFSLERAALQLPRSAHFPSASASAAASPSTTAGSPPRCTPLPTSEATWSTAQRRSHCCRGSDFYVSASVDGTNFFNIHIGSSATTFVSPEIYDVVVPATATEETPVALSAEIFDPQYNTPTIRASRIAKWSIFQNGVVYQTVTDAIENGEGIATDSFTPDDGGTYTASLYAYKYIYFSDGSSELVTPVLTTATIVVPGIAPTIDSESIPHFAPAGQAILLGAAAHDISPVEEAAGLTYSWNSSPKDGKLFTAGSGASFSFTPDGSGVFGSTLTVTDAAVVRVHRTGTPSHSGRLKRARGQ